jgi:hypothetical protein
LAFGIWQLSDTFAKRRIPEHRRAEADIISALDKEAALTTGKIWAENSEEQQQ